MFPVGVVLVSFLAGIIKNRIPTSKATVESVAKPGYLKKEKCVYLKSVFKSLCEEHLLIML